MKGLLIYYFAFVMSTTFVNANITYTETDGTLDIKYNNLILFRQTSDSPIFTIGVSETNFTNNQGNFVIEDSISERVSLENYNITDEEDPTRLVISFSTNTEPDLEIQFELYENVTEDGILHIHFEASLSVVDKYNRLWLKIFGTKNEKLFGAGQQYTYFNLKKNKFPIWTSEQGVGRNSGNGGSVVGDYYNTYWPQASYLSNRKYALFIYNTEYLEMDFRGNENVIYLHSLAVSGDILRVGSFKNLIPRVSRFLGKQDSLPDWILKGAVLGLEYGTEEVLKRYEEAKAAEVDVSGVWIQDWSGTTETEFGHRVYWNWAWNDTYYDRKIIEQFAADGVQTLVYANPHLIESSQMFAEAAEFGYFLRDEKDEVYLQDFGGFYAATVDLFNETAKNWYAGKLKGNMVDLGINGWMADFGEYTSVDMVSTSEYGTLAESGHNEFPLFWAETNRQVIDDTNETISNNLVYFMRSGTLLSGSGQRLAWAGDQNVDFSDTDGLATTIVAALSLAVSGMGVTHFDIGGYTSAPPVLTRSAELLLRSAEYAVFTPVMRTHLGNNPGDGNAQIYSSTEILKAFARLTRIHTKLFNYTKNCVKQNVDSGIPIQRPMFYAYENDPHSFDLWYQYMYGDDLIVAPVLSREQSHVDIYVPEGDDAVWIPLWSDLGEEDYVVGPRNVSLRAPVGFPGVLFRSGSEYQSLFEDINKEFGFVSDP